MGGSCVRTLTTISVPPPPPNAFSNPVGRPLCVFRIIGRRSELSTSVAAAGSNDPSSSLHNYERAPRRKAFLIALKSTLLDSSQRLSFPVSFQLFGCCPCMQIIDLCTNRLTGAACGNFPSRHKSARDIALKTDSVNGPFHAKI